MKLASRLHWLVLTTCAVASHLMANELGTLFFSPSERRASAPISSATTLRIQGVTHVGSHWVVWLGAKPIAQQEMIAGWRFVGVKKDQVIFTSPARGEIHLMMGDALPVLAEIVTGDLR